jgi:predicted ATP-grasp superfamily ATP-dependent carboligase
MTAVICKVAIVGASARAAAFSALNAGLEVATADMFADADLARECDATRVERYPEGLAEWLASSDCDAWLYTGALENYPELIDRMAALRPLLGNRGDVLCNVRNPMWLQAALTARGIAFPESRSSPESLPLDGSWLCKTYRGASGSGVWRLNGSEALEQAHQRSAWFQQYVDGESHAAIFVVASYGTRLLGVTQQKLNPRNEWQYSGSIGPAEISPSVAAHLDALGGLLHEWGMRGVVGVDFLATDTTAIIVEINPRFTASVEIVEHFAGCSALEAHVAACTTSAPPRSSVPGSHMSQGHSHYAKAILYARSDAVITPLFHDCAMTCASLDARRRALADIPNPGEVIPTGRPVLTALATGNTRADCQQQLDDRLADVEIRLYCGQ